MPPIDNEERFIVLLKKLLSQPSVKKILVDKGAANINTIIKHHYDPEGEGATSDIQWVTKLINLMPTIFCFLYISKTKVARQVRFSPYDSPSSLILVYKISSDNIILLKFY